MSDLCKTGCARVREHVRRLASIGGGVMQGQRFAGSRPGVQVVDCTALLVLAVIRCYLFTSRGGTGNGAGTGDEALSRRCAFLAEHGTAHETHAG